MSSKTITFAMPQDMGRMVEKTAKKEGLSVNELVLEAVRQYDALNTLSRIAAHARKLVKKKGLTEKDFGGPFAK